MSNGKILQNTLYHQLLSSCHEFQDLVNALKETSNSNQCVDFPFSQRRLTSAREITQVFMEKQIKIS